MSSMAQVAMFCKDVAKNNEIWVIQFDGGTFVNWVEEDGSEIFPIWSSKKRVEKIISLVEEFSSGQAEKIIWENFKIEWIPKFIDKKVSLGPNWIGENLKGISFNPISLVQRVDRLINS